MKHVSYLIWPSFAVVLVLSGTFQLPNMSQTSDSLNGSSLPLAMIEINVKIDICSNLQNSKS